MSDIDYMIDIIKEEIEKKDINLSQAINYLEHLIWYIEKISSQNKKPNEKITLNKNPTCKDCKMITENLPFTINIYK